MKQCFKNPKVWCAVGGFAAAIIGGKIVKAPATRKATVSGMAKVMKLGSDAKASFQNMKDDAADLCYDAKTEAGLNADEAEEVTEEA